jgi:putative membrane protein
MKTAVAAVALIALSGSAFSQVRVNMKVGRPEDFNRIDPHKIGLNKSDRAFIKTAFAANSFEVKIGHLAQNRGSSTWVKEFGMDMAREHGIANNELKPLAIKKGAALSNAWPASLKKNYNMLARLHGAAFDRAFTKINKQGHLDVMKDCQREIRNGHDASIRSYATGMLATARSHEMMVINRTTMMAGHGTYGSAAQHIKP